MNGLLSQADPSGDVSRIVLVVGVLLALVLIGAVVALKLRRRLLSSEDSAGTPLTLHDLRRLHADGNMTDEEFEKAKAAIIGTVARPAKPAKPEAARDA